MKRPEIVLLFALPLLVTAGRATSQPVTTVFTYQGRLTEGGAPADGIYDFRFILYKAAVGGAQDGPIVTRDDVAVSGGLFTVSLDFGPIFSSNSHWLEIGVRPGSSTGAYTVLSSRQELTPTPKAVFSLGAPWSGLTGVPAGFADGIDNNSGGDITGVTAGAGLTGGGTSGAVTLAVDFAGTGTAASAARSDHDHFGQAWSGTLIGAGLQVTNSGSFSAGLRGVATATSGINEGVYGESASDRGNGVHGVATATSGTAATGVRGESDSNNGSGVFGIAYATSGQNAGVLGFSYSTAGFGVVGDARAISGSPTGVFGKSSGSPEGTGVLGVTFATSGVNYGVRGLAASTAGYAGYFSGRVAVTGLLSKGGGSFKIDHPLDPENKYLYHSFVESPDMMNVYNGNVTTDESGFAVVEMPEWFEALNRDFRYQLTVIDGGDGWVFAKVAREMENNRFAIRTSVPLTKLSWQVTGIRRDAFAEAHRIPVEEDKPAEERGTYLHPLEHDRPQEMGRDHTLMPLLRERGTSGPTRREEPPSP